MKQTRVMTHLCTFIADQQPRLILSWIKPPISLTIPINITVQAYRQQRLISDAKVITAAAKFSQDFVIDYYRLDSVPSLMTFALVQDRYNSNWLDMHNGVVSNQPHYNDTGNNAAGVNVPGTSYPHFTGNVGLFIKRQDSMARQCNQNVNAIISTMRL